MNFNDIKVNESTGVDFDSINLFEGNNDCSISVYTNYGNSIDVIRQPKIVRRYLFQIKQNPTLIYDLQSPMGKEGIHRHFFFVPFCNNNRLLSESSLNEHKERCGALNKQLPCPPEQKTYKFKKFCMTLRQPYILYYKTECVKVKNNLGDLHVPIAYALCLVSATELLLLEYYDGENVISHFLKRALEISKLVIEKNQNTNNWIQPTLEQLEIHLAKTVCDF